jgi:dihydroorotate dehydrogenase
MASPDESLCFASLKLFDIMPIKTHYYKVLRPFLFALPAETAHNLSIFALRKNLVPEQKRYENEKLQTQLFGINFKNPVGLAAGFDKNAECIAGLAKQNFGFIELGTTTPVPQAGNAKPRMFRLKKYNAVINRLGFNNEGVELFSQRLREWRFSNIKKSDIKIGANIGKNAKSPNDSSDYLKCMEKVYGLSDYITINISSPNTANLRDLHSEAVLEKFITDLIKKRNELAKKKELKVPLLLKISPDLKDDEFESVARIVLETGIDGVIISNTTIKRDFAKEESFAENKYQGGLSGKPLFKKSTTAIAKFYELTGGKVPIIGVGGIFTFEDAYAKIRAGASLVQIYTGLVYNGFSMVNRINKGIVVLLHKDGFNHISEAVGIDAVKK